jgi:REP element-mobilizing transposase RayT
MISAIEFKNGGHVVFMMRVHLVFVTKSYFSENFGIAPLDVIKKYIPQQQIPL